MPPPIIAHITWAIISHARGVGEVQAVMGVWGRRKGRAPISRTNLVADFDFWLLGLDASPDYRSDHRRERLPREGVGRSSCSLRSTDLRGRRTGRAPISREHLGADYYSWLLDLASPPRLSLG